TDTREWYGIRVLMAVLNNWDLKDSNNSIYQLRGDQPEQRYVVSDLGSSFGSPGINWAQKGNLKDYSHSKLVAKVSPQWVDFHVPAAPKVYVFFDIPNASMHARLSWLGHHIPIADVRWMARLLGQLSPQQVRDAFRAADYSPQDVEAYSK